MTKALSLAVAGGIGFMVGLLLFLAIDFSFESQVEVDELGMWTEYGWLILCGVGAISGVVMAWAALARMNKPQRCTPMPNETPPADVAGRPRVNSRPLKWLYRA